MDIIVHTSGREDGYAIDGSADFEPEFRKHGGSLSTCADCMSAVDQPVPIED